MRFKNITILALVLLAVNCGSECFGKDYCDSSIKLKSVDFPGNRKEDGYWSALHCGSDGKVYIGLNIEGGGHGQFYIYYPETGKIKHRADMAEFLGESGKGIKTHSKIHTKFCEDKEGNIYFATGNMGAGPEDVDPMSWKGGHWIKYDPKTDTLTDLGLVAPYRGVYGLDIDKERSLLLGVCRNGHFMVYNIATGQTIDKGRVNLFAQTAERTVICDDQGNAYGFFHPGRMFKYDAKQQRVLDLSVRLPFDRTVYPWSTSIVKRYMRSGVWDDVNKKMYGVEGGTSILFEYDPKVGEEGEIKTLARLTPYQASKEVRKGHFATLSLTLGRDRKIYYLPIGSMTAKDHKRGNDGIALFEHGGQAYLISYDLASDEKQCLGRVYTEDGAMVVDKLFGAPSGGAATGLDGTIYFCGYAEEKDPDRVARNFGHIPLRLRLLMYKPEK